MSNSFNFRRFSLLFKKHTVENYRTYLLAIIVYACIVAILLGLNTSMGKYPLRMSNQIITFFCLMFFSGTIFTSNIFINLSNKRKAVSTLTLPASTFEKFLVGWVYSYLIFQIVFTAVFYAVLWGYWRFNPDDTQHMMNIFSVKEQLYLLYIYYAFLHGVALYGAMYFKKAHFIQTAFTFFGIILLICLFNSIVLKAIIPVEHLNVNLPFFGITFIIDENYYRIGSLYFTTHVWVNMIFVLSAFIMWTATYFRLKEKQI